MLDFDGGWFFFFKNCFSGLTVLSVGKYFVTLFCLNSLPYSWNHEVLSGVVIRTAIEISMAFQASSSKKKYDIFRMGAKLVGMWTKYEKVDGNKMIRSVSIRYCKLSYVVSRLRAPLLFAASRRWFTYTSRRIEDRFDWGGWVWFFKYIFDKGRGEKKTRAATTLMIRINTEQDQSDTLRTVQGSTASRIDFWQGCCCGGRCFSFFLI